MLFNTYTINACFLSKNWKITSQGMFAGSCIGVFFLTMALEFLRRTIKEYDRFLIHQHMTHFASLSAPAAGAAARSASVSSKDGITPAARRVPPFRPNVWQQAIRAFLHMTAFFVGYILMLVRRPRSGGPLRHCAT